MQSIPVITGLGLISPLGSSLGATWQALLEGRFIRTHARCPYDSTSPDRVHQLAIAAASEAIADAQWTRSHSHRTALVVGTSKGDVETWLTPPSQISDLSPACGLAHLAARLGETFPLLDGTSLTYSAACASGLHALIRGVMMIRSGEADRVLIVAAEASVHPLFLASFRRLGVLPREGVGCRPFDKNREGFLMSEAAAAVCLEASEGEVRNRGSTTRLSSSKSELAEVKRPAYARIDRFALGGDATHMTAGDPGGSTLRRLLQTVVAARPVDLIHAHGTGTTFNDPIELAAFEDLCAIGESSPIVYSHKGALGHSLGAAGLVSVVLNCVMHARGIVPSNVQTRYPLETKRVRIVTDAKAQATIKRSIVVAAGFGGSMAVVSLVSP